VPQSGNNGDDKGYKENYHKHRYQSNDTLARWLLVNDKLRWVSERTCKPAFDTL
jgi:hypothetical protein